MRMVSLCMSLPHMILFRLRTDRHLIVDVGVRDMTQTDCGILLVSVVALCLYSWTCLALLLFLSRG